MKKFLTLITILTCFKIADAQPNERLDGQFIYEKLVDIYHKSLSVNDSYFGNFGFGYGEYVLESASDGSIVHPHANETGDKEFSFTTRSLTSSVYTTIESAYATNSRKEFNRLQEYVISLGYRLTNSQYSKLDRADNQIFQMDNLMVTFVHFHHGNKYTYKAIYSLNVN